MYWIVNACGCTCKFSEKFCENERTHLSSTCKSFCLRLWSACVCLGAWVVWPLAQPMLLCFWTEDGSSYSWTEDACIVSSPYSRDGRCNPGTLRWRQEQSATELGEKKYLDRFQTADTTRPDCHLRRLRTPVRCVFSAVWSVVAMVGSSGLKLKGRPC